MRNFNEFGPGGTPIFEIGKPLGPDAKYYAGKMRVVIGRQYSEKSTESQVFFLTPAERDQLLDTLCDSKYGAGKWSIEVTSHWSEWE